MSREPPLISSGVPMIVGVKTRSDIFEGRLTRTRPKLSASVIASPERSTVNLAGPHISTLPPAKSVIRAFAECTVTTLPFRT